MTLSSSVSMRDFPSSRSVRIYVGVECESGGQQEAKVVVKIKGAVRAGVSWKKKW